jgi:hypothetical protein
MKTIHKNQYFQELFFFATARPQRAYKIGSILNRNNVKGLQESTLLKSYFRNNPANEDV